jgi:hypothetical protein
MKPLMEHAVHPLAERPCLFGRPVPQARVTPSITHGEALVAQIERHAGQQMGGADRREIDPDGGDGAAGMGRAHYVHGDDIGIGRQRPRPKPRHQASKPRQADR